MNERELKALTERLTEIANDLVPAAPLAKRCLPLVKYVRKLQGQVKGLRKALTECADQLATDYRCPAEVEAVYRARAALTATAPEDEP